MLLLPQIVHNIRTGINPGFEPFYILGFMATKFLLPLYERSCPSNHFVLTPMIGLVITLFLLYAIQVKNKVF
jgi:hypothetical protein